MPSALRPLRRRTVQAGAGAVAACLVMTLAPTSADATPSTPAAAPITSTRVAGIDVDRSTIPQLERAMNRHRLTSVQLVRFYLHRIHRLNPKLHAVITVSRT